MKILHTADMHIGTKNNSLPLDRQQKLQQTQLLQIGELFDIAIRENYDLILICGDLFHKKTVPAKLANLFFHNVEKFSKPVLYIKGNHDEKFEFISYPSNFIILDENNPYLKINDVNFYSNKINLTKLEKSFNNNEPNILVGHGDIYNSRDNDYIDLSSILSLENFDYVALGHIHKFSKEIFHNNLVVYSGSLFSNGFDECGDKGFVEVNINDKNTDIKFHNFAKIKFFVKQVDITNKNDFESIVLEIEKALVDINKDDFVKIELVGYFDQNTEKYLSLIKDKFSDYYIDIIDNSRIKINFDEIYSEKLSFKAEFLSLVSNCEEDEDIKSKICQIGIEALKGENLSL